MKLLINMAILLVFITSCEKVIDVNLDSVEKKYVIEGNITNVPGTCQVKITQTKDFDEDNTFPGVSGATVTVSDNGGTPVALTETSTGVYETTAINGTIGHTYTLTVNVGGQTFTAPSTMPVLVTFDSIYIDEQTFFGDLRKVPTLVYQDPEGKGNGYHFIQYKNGVRESTIFVRNDDFTDGNKITTALLSFGGDDDDDEDKIKTGDTIRVVMECIDPAGYKYWSSLEAASGDSNNATPANPVTNITGGALGYFSAHTTEEKTIVVQ
jgi:hypothetical protein